MKKIKYIIFLSLLFSVGIGYSLLSDTVVVSGSATAVGVFDINVVGASVVKEVGCMNSEISISSDKKSVDVNVPALEYPGSYVKYSVTVKNEGNISAKLVDIVEKSMGDENIEVIYTKISENSILDPNKSLTFYVNVKWRETSTAGSDGADIDIDFVYEQNV